MIDAILGLDTRVVLAALLLVLDVWSIWLMTRASPSRRELLWWSVVILFVPVFGCLFWYALGPKPRV